MSVRKSSYDYYDELNGDGQEENPASFEVIRRYTPDNQEETVAYTRSNDEAVGAAGAYHHQKPENGLKADCEKYLDMIKKDVGKDDGDRKPLMIVVIGKKQVRHINGKCDNFVKI